MITLLVIGTMIVLLMIGIPIGITLACAGGLGLLLTTNVQVTYGIFLTIPFRTVASYTLTVAPMFILMAEFASTGLTQSLFDFTARRTRKFPASLGVATVIANAIMGAICGSSTAAAATMSRIAIPEMIRKGYPNYMAAGIVAVSGTLSVMIPPSIVLVLYGILAEVSVGKLLIAGIIPGILSAIVYSIIIIVWFKAEQRRQNIAPDEVLVQLAMEGKDTFKNAWREFAAIAPVIIIIILVLGGIYSGIITPTEAAAVGALAVLILGLIKRDQNPKKAYEACLRALKTNCMIFTIMIGARIFGYYLTLSGTTDGITNWFHVTALPNWQIILALVVFYILLGCLMDGIAILLLTVPVIAPIIGGLGFDLIWFGIVVTKLVEVGLITPPVGINCFIVADTAGIPVETAFKGVSWLILGEFILLAILILFPQIILFLPKFVMG